jgi:hypothetical protein
VTLFGQLLEVGLRGVLQSVPVTTEDPMARDSNDRVLRVVRGEDRTFRLTVFDEDDARQDLTGATITFRVKNLITDALAVIGLGVGTGITILDQSDPTADTYGQADVVLAGDDTIALDPGVKVYEVRVTLAGLVSSVIQPADFVLTREV